MCAVRAWSQGIAYLAWGALTASCGREHAGAGPDFELVATHADADAQPTARGRILATLTAHNGRLYAGYGDIDKNTGPIAVAAYDPALRAFVREWTSDTEAIYTFRVISGRLVAPAVDPRSAADYAVGPPWQDLRPIAADHVYDAASLGGRELWLAGSQGLDSVLWRVNEDGHGTEVLRVPPADTSGADFGRFYFVLTHLGRLYVHARDYHRGPKPASLVWDGERWADGPNLLPISEAQGWHPQAFAGRVVYLSRQTVLPEGSRLLVFDGTAVTLPLAERLRDIAVVGERLVALTVGGRILVSSNLAQWTDSMQAPAGARSIGALGRNLYVGTAAGKLYRSRRQLP